MSSKGSYQLPKGIEMPDRFSRFLRTQIWFYDGAQTALEGQQPASDGDIRTLHGDSAADAYRAGYEAGRREKDQNHFLPQELPF